MLFRSVFVENSPVLTSRGLGRVLGDLATLGYDAQWDVISAADVGAKHLRERIWIVAYANGLREPQYAWRECECRLGLIERGKALAYAEGNDPRRLSERAQETISRFGIGSGDVAHTQCERCIQMEQSISCGTESKRPAGAPQYGSFARRRNGWPVEPGMGRVAHGVAHRVDRIKALGNGQVSRVAATAFDLLSR